MPLLVHHSIAFVLITSIGFIMNGMKINPDLFIPTLLMSGIYVMCIGLDRLHSVKQREFKTFPKTMEVVGRGTIRKDPVESWKKVEKFLKELGIK